MSRTQSARGMSRPRRNGFAAGEQAPPSHIPASIDPGGPPLPRGLRIRKQLRAAQVFLPVLAAVLATLWLGGPRAAASSRAGGLRRRDPLRLAPAARLPLSAAADARLANAVALFPALAGAVAVVLLELAQNDSTRSATLLAAAVAAFVAIAVAIIGDRILPAVRCASRSSAPPTSSRRFAASSTRSGAATRSR